MITNTSLPKIIKAYQSWLKENDNNTFYHPEVVEALVKNGKTINDFEKLVNTTPKITNYRAFFNSWLKSEINDLNLKVLNKKFELGQEIDYIKAVLLKTKETKSVLKSGERIELTAYGDSKLQNREVVAFTFKFTDNLLTSYEDNTDKAENYFKSKDNPIELALEGKALFEYLNTNKLIQLLSEARLLKELKKSYSGSGLIAHLKQYDLLHLVPGDELFHTIRKDKRGKSFIKFVNDNQYSGTCPASIYKLAIEEFHTEINGVLTTVEKVIQSTKYHATDRATLLFKENQLEFTKDVSKVNMTEFSVPGEYVSKFYAIDEYLGAFEKYYDRTKFTQQDLAGFKVSTEEISNYLNDQTRISTIIDKLKNLNESRALELGASTTTTYSYQTNSTSSESSWYDKKWLVYLLLFLFFPIGLIGVAKNKSMSGFTKLVIFGIFVFLIYAAYKGNVSNSLNSSVEPKAGFTIDSTMAPSVFITNKSKEAISIAYGYKYKKGWRSIGWFPIKSDSTFQIEIPSDMINDSFYWYAESEKGMKWIGTDKKFCIDGQNAFDIKKKKTGKCSDKAVFSRLQIAGKYTQLEVK